MQACVRAGPPQFDTYVVPTDTFELHGKRLALVPLSVPSDMENPDALITDFSHRIEELLNANGVDVVPASEYRRIWDRLTAEARGFFDPYTGRLDESKYDAGVRQLMKEMRENFAPDAFIYPELWPVDAPLAYGAARWDGASQPIYPVPQGFEFVRALTLAVVVEDAAGNELYVNGHGLVVLERFDLESGGMVLIPRDEIFKEEGFIDEALTAVFSPLIEVLAESSTR